ncbi:hypothetical protein BGZ90_007603 [Linnemannia elongata]|nr:hypothetical protein BGZ90_007603 [Linnemannia elongata]
MTQEVYDAVGRYLEKDSDPKRIASKKLLQEEDKTCCPEWRRLYSSIPLGKLPSVEDCNNLAPPKLKVLTLVPIRELLHRSESDTPTMQPSPKSTGKSKKSAPPKPPTLRANSSTLFCYRKIDEEFHSRAAIKRHWTTHKHGALSARRVAIPIANSDIPASRNLSTNGDAGPPVNGNFPANDAPPVNGALPVNDAPPLNVWTFVSANVTRWNSKLHLVERVYSYRAVLEATSQELLLKRDVPSEERKKFKEFRNQLLSVEELNVLDEIIELLRPAAELTHWIGGSGYSTISQVYRKTEVAQTMHMKLQAQIESAWPRDDISGGMLLSIFRACCGRFRRSCRSHQKPPSQPAHRASDKIPPEVVSTVEPKPKCPLKLQIKLILPIRFKITPQINIQALTFFQPNCPTRERGQHPQPIES